MRSLVVLAAFLSLIIAPAAADPVAKQAFGSQRGPSQLAPAPHGSYAKGCLAGGVELPETAARWQAMRLSRNRNWGHPDAIAFIERLSLKAQQIGWPRLLIGDISQPRGGPMLSGHTSHQLGLDIDIWLRPGTKRPMSRKARERISSHVVVARGGERVNQLWTPRHHQVIKAAAHDPAVARIFVNAAIKKALCEAEPPGPARAWLRKVRPWWKHTAHFHVRLNCPLGAAGCRNQAVIPAGDGCHEVDWWFSREARAPKKKPTKKARPRALRVSDLPMACAAVLAR